MRRPVAYASSLVATAALAAALGFGLAGDRGDPEPRPPVPRACWYSDYERARLSNACEFDRGTGLWYLEGEGRRVRADRQPLPVANLCHYFHGESCPRRGDGT